MLPLPSINARTWQSLRPLVVVLFAIIAAGFVFHPTHPFLRIAYHAAIIVLVFLGLIGAWLGIHFTLGRLYFGCPFCNARSRVIGLTKKDMTLSCPGCGEVCVSSRPFRSAVAEKVDTEAITQSQEH